ncbi:1959_t:CDS:2, partial [Racocetra persica]
HVDHGKTTLSDSLLASNGIISSKLAGKVRYLDSREDEQERGITMEASGISLYFQILRKAMEKEETITNSDEYLINLIDAPGHVDFSSEVSTASRLCDGALILVDVVEGVCTQTHTVLRQAWVENVRPILILNKIDRLITELKLTPLEAQVHLNKIIEQVNAIVGTYFAGDVMEEETKRHEAEKEKLLHQGKDFESMSSDEEIFEEYDDSNIYFTPESGNVVFASALDGWAFRIEQFAQIYAAKLGIKESILRKVLWGDYYLDPKTKRFLQHKHLKGRQLKPMFVQFVLENIWTVYDSVIINNNREKVEKIVKNIKEKPINEVEHGLFSCNVSDSAPVVAYVSKMFAVHSDMLPENRRKQLSAEELREKGRLQRIARLHSSNTRAGEEPALNTAASD